MKQLVQELDKLVHPHGTILQAARIAALITANWPEIRKALLASQIGTVDGNNNEKANPKE